MFRLSETHRERAKLSRSERVRQMSVLRIAAYWLLVIVYSILNTLVHVMVICVAASNNTFFCFKCCLGYRLCCRLHL